VISLITDTQPVIRLKTSKTRVISLSLYYTLHGSYTVDTYNLVLQTIYICSESLNAFTTMLASTEHEDPGQLIYVEELELLCDKQSHMCCLIAYNNEQKRFGLITKMTSSFASKSMIVLPY